MKKTIASFFVIVILLQTSFAQTKTKTYPIRPSSLGISFIFNDFSTADQIRNGSISRVFNNKSWAKFSQMSPGLAISYYKGLTPFVDFAGTLVGSFVNSNSVLKNSQGSNQNFFLEGDASLQAKLLPENFWVTPFVSGGVGIAEFTSHYSAFIPLGLGVKLNLFDEAAITIGSQYRIPVTTSTNNYHFMYSIGFAGVIGK